MQFEASEISQFFAQKELIWTGLQGSYVVIFSIFFKVTTGSSSGKDFIVRTCSLLFDVFPFIF